jgi:hypothetical protein
MKVHSLQFIEAIFVNGTTTSHIRLADNNQCPVSDIIISEDSKFLILSPKRHLEDKDKFPITMVPMHNVKYISIIEEELKKIKK